TAIADHYHVDVRIADGRLDAPFCPRPRQPVLDVVARHLCDVFGIGGSGEAYVDVSGFHEFSMTLVMISPSALRDISVERSFRNRDLSRTQRVKISDDRLSRSV